jgi:hypothetical protein
MAREHSANVALRSQRKQRRAAGIGEAALARLVKLLNA